MRVTFLFAAVCLCCLSACEGDEPLTPRDTGAETYFPLELNSPAFYTVDSIVLRSTVRGTEYDTARVQARETLVETFIGADGVETYRGERWERPDESQPWTFKQTFTLSRTATAATRSEDNLVITKLVFPVREGRLWDGHTAFDERRDVPVGGEFLDVYAEWDYMYAAVNEEATLPSGLTLDSTILVDQANVDNLIDYRRAYERYAAGLGLVERFIDARHTQCRVCCSGNTADCIDLPWDEKAEKGYIIHQVRL